jgi:hypothetical protein
MLSMVAQACKPTTWKAETGYQVRSQPGQLCETLSQNKEKGKKKIIIFVNNFLEFCRKCEG